MRVRGSVNYNNDIIEITEKNLTQIYFQHDEATTQIMVTLLINNEEVTFDGTSINELKLVQISDCVIKKLDLVEEKIKSVTTRERN